MSAPLRTDDELRAVLADRLDGLPPRRAAASVERLMADYRGRTPTDAPVLRDRADAVAYAAYRMPATFGAVRAALSALAERLPGWAPAGHLDVGGGTGAAAWAAAAVWGDGPADAGGAGGAPVRATTVLDWAGPALDFGRELAAQSRSAALRAAQWRRERIGAAPELPAADLVTVSYVLGELAGADRRAVVEAAAAAGGAVAVVEPGTPDGYLRVIEARELLIDAGLRVLAPCPHDGTCPIERLGTPSGGGAGQDPRGERGGDWCHFAARVGRSALHRRLKGGSLAYEDEKFSYVAAVRPRRDGAAAGARIVRKPQIRKGQVLLDLCTERDGLQRRTVSRRHGPAYRAARDAEWGGAWPPPAADADPRSDA